MKCYFLIIFKNATINRNLKVYFLIHTNNYKANPMMDLAMQYSQIVNRF